MHVNVKYHIIITIDISDIIDINHRLILIIFVFDSATS